MNIIQNEQLFWCLFETMKKKNKSNTSPTKESSGIGLGVWVGIAVLVVSICAILYFPTETKISKSSSETTMNSPSKVQSSTKPVVSNESKTKNEVMSYEEYIVVSKKNGWLPVDPVEKLEATIVKFGQVHINIIINIHYGLKLHYT